MDQTVWQSTTNTSKILNIFARLMGTPVDQNLIDLGFNGGITLTAHSPAAPTTRPALISVWVK